MRKKRISVCMATYNGERYVAQQINSILPLLGDNDELLISDDMSTDKTVKIISSIKDKHIKLFTGKKFGHPMKNFEYIMRQANGKYIYLSDQDDIWMPNKITKTLPLLKKYDLIVSDCNIIDSDGKEIFSSFFKLINSGPGVFKNLYRNTYLGCCMCFKKTLLNIALPFPEVGMHDIWLGFTANVYGKTLFCTDKLISYRRHEGNASTAGGKKSNLTLKKQIQFRFNMIINVIARLPKYIIVKNTQ